MKAGPSIEDAEARARELERLISHVEQEALKGDWGRTKFLNKRELGSVAGGLRFSLRYLLQAITRSRQGVIVCSSCNRETLELASSKNFGGSRCVNCAVPTLDSKIAALTAELEQCRRSAAPIEITRAPTAPEEPPQLTNGNQCQEKSRRPSARRSQG